MEFEKIEEIKKLSSEELLELYHKIVEHIEYLNSNLISIEDGDGANE